MSTLSVRQKHSLRWLRVLAGTMLAGTAALAFGVVGCGGGGGGGGGTASGSAAITTGISDPAQECAAPNGPYQAVWVTIQDVKAHISSSASSGDTGWQDLTPDLAANPVQVNLLSDTLNSDCLLATLGSTKGLKPGKYEQIRVYMVENGQSGVTLANGATNQCGGNIWNCVVTGSGTHALTLPSNANTGLKIPPGQLGHGGLTIVAGQGLDLDIDVNACQSVVRRGNSNNFSFKPTLRADELGTSPLIAGDIYVASADSTSVTIPTSSPSPVPGAKVWLEQQSTPVAVGTPSAGPSPTTETVEVLKQTTLTDPNGHFEFCPIGSGTYEIVAAAASVPNALGTPVPSDATITTGVNVSNSGGPNNLVIPLVPDATATVAAAIQGTFTTQNSVASGDDIQYVATQPYGGSSIQALVPEAAATPSADSEPPTATTGACSGGNCTADYEIDVPPGNPVVGAASTDGSGYAPPDTSSGTVNYSVKASASVVGTSTAVCSPSDLITQEADVSSGSVTGQDLTFESCD